MNFLKTSVSGQAHGETLGLRPEHLRVVDAGRISGRVTHVENLGGDTNVLIQTNSGEAITLRLFGQYRVSVGQAIALDFDDAHAFRFDADGARLR